MPVSISGTNGVTFPDSSLQSAAASPYVLKNRIINGDMRIDQRYNGTAFTGIDNYQVDRWLYDTNTLNSGSGGISRQRSTIAPANFTNSLLTSITAAGTVSAAHRNRLQQRIEGFNIADLGWGTANAQPVTLSFWVRSSLTGTFSGGITNYTGRSYPFTYTINAANTFEQKTVTIVGDTSGTWATDNGIGIGLIFDIGSGSNYNGTAGAWAAGEFFRTSGSVSLVANNGATFYITGVQLEQNTSATPFERRMYTTELQLCQRYCPMIGPVVADSFSAVGYTLSTTQGRVVFQFPVTARTAPTGITVTNATGFALAPPFARAASAIAFSESNTQYASVDVTVTGLTANQPTTLRIGSSGGCKIEFTGCEL